MIAVRNLVKTIKNGPHEVQIIRDLTFEVPSKQFVAVMGPSGSGKSTLLGLIAGLDWPSSGSIWIDARTLPNLAKMKWRNSAGRNWDLSSSHIISFRP